MYINHIPDFLVIGMMNGDQKSTEGLCEVVFGNCLWHLSCRRQFPREYAEDATQEVLLAILGQRNAPGMKDHPGSYAMRINRHKIVDALRELGKKTGHETELPSDEGVNEIENTEVVCDPEQIFIQQEQSNTQRNLLKDIREVGDAAPGTLKDGWKALLYHVRDGLSYAEIAEIMGVREGTVKSWISRFRNGYLPRELGKRGWTSADLREAMGF